MFLTKEEEKIYNGEYGETLETCMNLLVSLGDIYGAEKLIPISSAQVSGVSYKTIGEKGLEFLKDISNSNIKVSVPTTLNPAGMDLDKYVELRFPKEFAKKQLEVIECFKKMDIEIGCTCTPYLSGNVPVFGSHISWAESSAVSYANSIIGARTNREGGPSALASAILGKTPYYGYHLDENRLPTHIIEVDAEITKLSDYGALGSIVGKIVKNGVPYFKFNKLNIDDVSSYKSYKLKGLGASLAASGGVALYHVENITPEAKIVKEKIKIEGIEKITITDEDIKNEYESLNSAEYPDLICIGCPHCSLEEIKEVVDFIIKNNIDKNNRFKCDLWICTSIHIKSISDRMGYTKIIENAGGKIVCDTCMVVAPVEDMGYKNIATNSGKAAKYIPNFCNGNVIYGDIEEILKKGINL
jgi:predicted aconitase